MLAINDTETNIRFWIGDSQRTYAETYSQKHGPALKKWSTYYNKVETSQLHSIDIIIGCEKMRPESLIVARTGKKEMFGWGKDKKAEAVTHPSNSLLNKLKYIEK